MKLVNLTAEQLATMPLTFYERHLLRSGLENYAASSFAAVDEGFHKRPPAKRDPRSKSPSAYVHIGGVEARIIDEWRLAPEQTPPLFGLREDLSCPILELADGERSIITPWVAGGPAEFAEAKKTFDLSTQGGEVPEVTLQYHLLSDLFSGEMAYRVELRALRNERIEWPERQGLAERVRERVEQLIKPGRVAAPQPSYRIALVR